VKETQQRGVSRREMLKTSVGVAATSALAGVVLPAVHAGEDNTIKLALVGCGGRGTGAAENAFLASNGPTKLVAMADVFPHKLNGSLKHLNQEFSKQVDVPEDRRFIGFDSAEKAMSCLKPNDVVILTTPPAFRWPMFRLAIEKKLNVFLEKPVTVDGPSSRKMLKLNEEAKAKNIKVGVGLMCRHCDARKELLKRVNDGEIGDVLLIRAYRLHQPIASAFSTKKPEGKSELLYQIERFHSFLWASGGCFSDFLIHNIDEACWLKDGWPVQAKGFGGRHFRGDWVDQNFDSYTVEYTFADGSKFYMEGRCMPGCHNEFAVYAHGSKGCAVMSASGHTPARCRTYKGQNFTDENRLWRYPNRDEPNPYQLEWDHLLEAIRQDKPYNEVERGVKASVATSMGRMACHTGQVVTFDDMLNHEHEFAPEVDKLTMDGPAPLVADKDGKYPVPEPGMKKKREY
jgi:predicted dehydrogenase